MTDAFVIYAKNFIDAHGEHPPELVAGPNLLRVCRALVALDEHQATLRSMSNRMAEDDGLWFIPQTAPEAYLQQELRKLCAAIEGVSPEECARAALTKATS